MGPTGAGKTTLVNLLMRFFEINSGSIKIDGIPTSEMTRESVHNLFSMVLQDTWLFEGTVRENLVYNKQGGHGRAAGRGLPGLRHLSLYRDAAQGI